MVVKGWRQENKWTTRATGGNSECDGKGLTEAAVVDKFVQTHITIKIFFLMNFVLNYTFNIFQIAVLPSLRTSSQK